MKKIILLLALIATTIGLNAQTIGSYTIISTPDYELQYTVTKLSPAECSVKCINLTSDNAIDVITIPETMVIEGKEFTVTMLPQNAFAYCYSAKKFELPNTITTISDQAFYYCNFATDIAIPESVTSIGNKAFYGCAITEAIIPNGVTKINNGVFEICNHLSNVVIPNGVTSIGIMAFKGCSGLTEIDLPESISNLSDYIFTGCSSLTLVRCYATNPPTASSKIFYNTPENLIIRVPAESIELYKSTAPWSEYDIRAIGSESIEEEIVSFGIFPNPVKDNLVIEAETEIEDVVIYDVYGRQHDNITTRQQGMLSVDVSSLSNGVYFVKVKTENEEMVKRFVKE